MTHKEWLEKTGGCAFPTPDTGSEYGMTLRDYFAAKAMNGELASQSEDDDCTYTTTEEIKGLAEWSYAMADAMLAERAK